MKTIYYILILASIMIFIAFFVRDCYITSLINKNDKETKELINKNDIANRQLIFDLKTSLDFIEESIVINDKIIEDVDKSTTATTIKEVEVIEKKPISKPKKVYKKVKQSNKAKKENIVLDSLNDIEIIEVDEIKPVSKIKEDVFIEAVFEDKKTVKSKKKAYNDDFTKRNRDENGDLIPVSDAEWQAFKDNHLKKYGVDLDPPDNINNYKTSEEKAEAIRKLNEKHRGIN